jgi:hypothetical protein
MNYSAADKYHAMLRAYERLKIIYTDNGRTISNRDASDATNPFFSECYHLKDWLKKDQTIQLNGDVERYVSDTTCLSIAGDFCNSQKHAGLTKPPRSGAEVKKTNTHIQIAFGAGSVVASSSFSIMVGDKEYDALELATQCIEAWQRFLSKSTLNFSL